MTLAPIPVSIGVFGARLGLSDLGYVLASRLGVPRSSIEVTRDERGKPRIEHPRTDLRFSVSHASSSTVVAFARGREVGVDVEFLGREVTAWTMWPDVLTSAELERLPATISARNAHLLGTWVAKEAILKASGFGLAVDPREIELGPSGELRVVPDELGRADDWSLARFRFGAFVGAVAVAA
jgi:4'-phosphopantetheinyl transferase